MLLVYHKRLNKVGLCEPGWNAALFLHTCYVRQIKAEFRTIQLEMGFEIDSDCEVVGEL